MQNKSDQKIFVENLYAAYPLSAPLHIVGIYRPHSGTAETLVAELVEIFNRIPNILHKNIILIGDFNVSLMEALKNPAEVLCSFMRPNYISSIISRATFQY